MSGNADSDTSAKLRMPSFATNYVVRGYHMDTRAKLFIGDTRMAPGKNWQDGYSWSAGGEWVTNNKWTKFSKTFTPKRTTYWFSQ